VAGPGRAPAIRLTALPGHGPIDVLARGHASRVDASHISEREERYFRASSPQYRRSVVKERRVGRRTTPRLYDNRPQADRRTIDGLDAGRRRWGHQGLPVVNARSSRWVFPSRGGLRCDGGWSAAGSRRWRTRPNYTERARDLSPPSRSRRRWNTAPHAPPGRPPAELGASLVPRSYISARMTRRPVWAAPRPYD